MHSAVAPRAATTTDVNASLAVASDAAGDRFMFWKGEDGNLWYSLYNVGTGTWSAPAFVAGEGPLGSEPTVAIDGVGPGAGIFVFWQGADNNLWYTSGLISVGGGGEGTGTETLGLANFSGPTVVAGMGPLGSKPSAVYAAAGNSVGFNVFWKGSDGNLWDVKSSTITITGTSSSATWPASPSVISGMATLGSEPTSATDAAGDLFVYWQGSGNNTRVWEAWDNHVNVTATWSGPLDLGTWSGNTGSAPAVAVNPVSGDQYIFWQGQDSNLYYEMWNGSGWHGWNYVGDGPMNSKPAVTFTGNGMLFVAWKGTDLNVWDTSVPVTTTGGYNTADTVGTWTTVASLGDGPIDGQ